MGVTWDFLWSNVRLIEHDKMTVREWKKKKGMKELKVKMKEGKEGVFF